MQVGPMYFFMYSCTHVCVNVKKGVCYVYTYTYVYACIITDIRIMHSCVNVYFDECILG